MVFVKSLVKNWSCCSGQLRVFLRLTVEVPDGAADGAGVDCSDETGAWLTLSSVVDTEVNDGI